MKKMKYVCCLAALFLISSCGNKTNNQCEHQHEHTEEHEDGHHHDGDEEEHDHEGEHHDDGEKHPDGEITFTLEQAKEADLRLEEVKLQTFSQVIKASGKIVSATNDEVSLVASTNGIVTFASDDYAEGSPMKAEQIFAYVSAKNVADGETTRKQHIEMESAKAEYERMKQLLNDKLVTMKEYSDAKLRYEQAQATYSSLSGSVSDRGVAIKSPMKGYIKAILVQSGQYVEVGTPLAVVTKNKSLQLRVDVPERNYADLGNIRSANFKVSYDTRLYELSKLGGKMLSYSRNVSQGSGTVAMNFEFDNVGGLMSGAYAEVYLLAAQRENIISVPVSALCESQGLFFVFVRHKNECFVRREVKLGQSNGERVEILSGLSVGDNVVTNGTVQVRVSANTATIPAHNHNH